MIKMLDEKNKEILKKEIFGSAYYKKNNFLDNFKKNKNEDIYEKTVNKHNKDCIFNAFALLFMFGSGFPLLVGVLAFLCKQQTKITVLDCCCCLIIFAITLTAFIKKVKEMSKVSTVYINNCHDMIQRPYRKEVSYNSLEILADHYPEFYIKEKFANKGPGKLSYYDLLDEDLFFEIFKFRKNAPTSSDRLFLETLEKLKEEKRLTSSPP